ncbi:MAG: hypothetical protein HKN09_07025 [Saprospiraceae bacterium]|nr:hypothetical protein [Saprospiraceae bacterium]
MKKINSYSSFLLIVAVLALCSLQSCLKDECDETRVFIEYEAIYVQPEEFRIDITTNPAREMKETGKMYFYNDYILVNERYEGVHVINNEDPQNPINEAFLHIPGNLDIAIKDNHLYADNYVDLLTIDISDFNNPQIVCRDEEVFSRYSFHENLGYYIYSKPTERSIEVECGDPNFGANNFNRNGTVFWAEDAISGGIFDNNASGVTGTGGSFARFSLIFDHLYVLNDRELIAYQLENPAKPMKTETTLISWGGIETIFPYKNYLFIGANNGMYIYDASTPSTPVYVSEFRHATACDPVYVRNDIAFVTLRNGRRCESFTNQLDVIDVSNIRLPDLIASFDMDNPHGLSVDNNNLYLCEGEDGLKVFETKELDAIDKHRIDHIKGLHAYDVIQLSESHLLVIGADGLYQFDTSDPSELQELSYLPVSK